MSQQTSRVDSIFCAAVEIESTEQRAAYMEQACGGNPELKGRVEKLLEAHFRAGSFLESPAPELDATGQVSPITERPGVIIGRYKLMERIGEGGMGVVYVAEQREPVRRKVALKIIKPGMDTKEVIARFEAERQALALMDHPNIARVLDAGATESGRPYFVMELVRGIPITDYCDQNNLTARERLELFLSVCQAVQHAHQKGVIHRDVKPTNVLVTLHDGKPVPKIIDFGVAKAINQQLTERTVYTRHMQMIGTPLYMSPEQAELSGLDVDTRTDIYALGVLLYELLTGTTPFDKERLREAAYDEVRRIIREEEPPKPSTRISTLGEPATAISAHRKTDPKRLSQLVRGDLDWIVMKALEKDRTRRYETATGFARDVERYLKDEPVEARAPSALYRLRKFVRRNKVAVTTATLVALTLLFGAVGITWERSKGAFGRLIAEVHTSIDRGDLAGAEGIIEELRGRGDGGRAETLSAQRRLAWRYAKPEVDRLEDAVQLMRKTLETQQLVLGEEHEDALATAQSLKDLGGICLDWVWERTIRPGASQADCERAIRLTRLAREYADSEAWFLCLLGMGQYRCGQWPASLDSQVKSLESDGEFWWAHPFLFAMVHARLGQNALARDWYAAGCDWMNNTRAAGQGARDVWAEAALLLGLPGEDAAADETSADLLTFYSEMIERYPRAGLLSYRRGILYARAGNWKEAADDLARATELSPRSGWAWEARGAVCLQIRDVEGYEAACREMLTRLGGPDNGPSLRVDCGVLCCLGPSKEVKPAELYQVANDALPKGGDNYEFMLLGKAMAAYRCGQYREAVDVLSRRTFTGFPKDDLLAILFKAMSHQKLGQSDQGRELLDEARRRIPEWLPLSGPFGGKAAQGRTVCWCMVQAVLREAEELIEPATQGGVSGGEGVEK